LENDFFGGTDQYYTSGAKIGWSSANLQNLSDSPYARPFLKAFDLLPGINEKVYQKNLLFCLGQNIYTPKDTTSTALVPNERPYAGWLYLGVGVAWKTAEVRNTLVLDVGVVGPWSYAKETQRAIHDALGQTHPNGWANQLHNELGITGVFLRDWRLPIHARRVGLNCELLPHAGVAVGNVQTYANVGGELRMGINLPDDFGTTGITPSATTSTPVDGLEAAPQAKSNFGLYVFGRVDGRAVVHSIFLDGNTFGHSHSVDRKWAVADLSVGLGTYYKNTKLAYALVYRTEEYKGQQEGQVFGTLSVNITF